MSAVNVTIFLRIAGSFLPFVMLLAGMNPRPVSAQDAFNLSDNESIAIEAEGGIEWLRDQRQYRASGKAVATRGDLSVQAETLIAYYRGGEAENTQNIFRVDALDDVVITSRHATAYGDKAVYHVERQIFVLVGADLRLVTDDTVITAEESLEFWQDRNLAVARGKATVSHENNRLRAGALTAFIRADAENAEQALNRIDATGGVHISTEGEILRGREGVYEVPEQRFTLCGDVKITRGGNQLNGECAVVDMRTGKSRLEGGDGKVRGLILSPDG